ncbi:hypothetical protein [Chitinophaga nivalis]|uniref:Uncharacterized protein n=1 Tax=Chitinophaga nivalis TaxID=2991709 RepID=A0ABT3IHN6_9BACT|nr:hypothetical protein [Chitinophaga nivalis]MCW3466829.1 hypothetical protein [Chitinophaga nivalis]MCW3483480.1 hypothetical protein [Chitinophaga nivalis]
MKARILFICLLFTSLSVFAQEEENDDPVYVLDSVLVTPAAVSQLSADQIGVITIAKGRRAILKYGSQAANGVVYMETKPFARKRVQALLREVAPAYDSLMKCYMNDSSCYFIVNDKPVTPTDEARMMTLDKKTFRSLQIITDKKSREQYLVPANKVGILIRSTED